MEKNSAKKMRDSPHSLPIYLKCGHKGGSFQGTLLQMKETIRFHSKFYGTKEKTFQDNFLLKYCKTVPIQRKRPKNSQHVAKTFQTRFYIMTNENRMLAVCKKAFMEVLGKTRRRIDTVTKNFYRTFFPAMENRGGDKKLEKYMLEKSGVMDFINKFRVIESHYCRGQSQRLYLDSSLNIKSMWKMYLKENKNFPVKESYIRKIFITQYILGFGSPRTDACSTCLQLTEKIKACRDNDMKANLIIQKRVHTLRSKAFYTLLKERDEGVETFSFDCQKKSQFYMYNFTVVRGTSKSNLNPSNITSFCWTENDYKKSSNEVAFCIYYILELANFGDDIRTIRLMYDGYEGQNKNTTLIYMRCYWFSRQDKIRQIEVIFLVRGHFFMSPDRVFGNIEKDIKKKKIILKPHEYLKMFSKYSTVHWIGELVEIYDWKNEKSITKKTKNIERMKPTKFPKHNAVVNLWTGKVISV
ncbi:unnamed protein product [Diabrotica balteata]|uniref:DUF7869 domain-containing protein n=1 Tax=Diabrotica balteata TaxID=107213 RepID=A0A9N9SZ32_DIABA|nr:unnamed protein product [Diabrotica balteata]